jgi:hypothetical protein
MTATGISSTGTASRVGASLRVVSGPHIGARIDLPIGETLIGRASDCISLLRDDDALSRYHARLMRDSAEGAWVEDLRSKNGTLINQTSVSTPTLARPRDLITLGRSTLELVVEQDENSHDQSHRASPRPRAVGVAPELAQSRFANTGDFQAPPDASWHPSPVAPPRRRDSLLAHDSSGRSNVVGAVRNIKDRHEGHHSICNFVVERYDDNGDRLQPMPVELRARKVSGALNDGDWVQVPGSWKQGKTKVVKRVWDITTDTDVGQKRLSMLVVALLILLAALLLVIVLPFFVGSGGGGSVNSSANSISRPISPPYAIR